MPMEATQELVKTTSARSAQISVDFSLTALDFGDHNLSFCLEIGDDSQLKEFRSGKAQLPLRLITGQLENGNEVRPPFSRESPAKTKTGLSDRAKGLNRQPHSIPTFILCRFEIPSPMLLHHIDLLKDGVESVGIRT